MIIPALVLMGLIGGIAWLVKPKGTGVVGEAMGYDEPRSVPGGRRFPALPPLSDLSPEQQRLLSLLVLYARDRQYPAGQKRYLTAPLALEATRLAKNLGLPKTSMAIRKDGPVPEDEFFPDRTESIRSLTIRYGSTGQK